MSDSPISQAALDALLDLALFQCMDRPLPFWPEHRDKSFAEPGDAQAPLVSEAFLYPLLGKEDARVLLARFRALYEALGISAEQWGQLHDDAYRRRARFTVVIQVADRDQRRDAIDRCGLSGDRLRGCKAPLFREQYPILLREITQDELETVETAMQSAGYPVEHREMRLLSSNDLADISLRERT